MDWDLAIGRNRQALKRILDTLVAMAGIAVGPHPEARAEGEPRRTLPRRLHRAVLRLLRPAEAAARRLIVIAARGIVVTLPPPRPRKPKPETNHAALRSLGVAVSLSRAEIARMTAETRAAARRAAARAARPPMPSLPLFDPRRLPGPDRRRYLPAHSVPRILSFDGAPWRPLPPRPDDLLDATRIGLRLAALGRALDDLPGHARRFARWRTRRTLAGAGAQERSRIRRLSPLKPGLPPGLPRREARGQRTTHEVYHTLRELHGLARWALADPDTS